MDDEQENINKTQEVNVKLIYYLNNDNKKEGNLSLNYNKEMKIISYNDIIISFYSFLIEEKAKKNSDLCYEKINLINIIYKSIRYFDGYGWVLLNEDDVIILDENLSLDTLKIMIYSEIINEKNMSIKKKYDEIEKDISNIYNEIIRDRNYDLPPYAPLNLVVLTANPLMDGEKELRIMNDFNIIASKIYRALDDEDFLKYTEFLPLTLNTLKYFITNEQKRPVILHLICKSTYILSEDNEDYTKLIFEDDNNYYNSEFINKEKLEKEIFNYNSNPKLKENVNKIILIISTPLATDIYDIFKNFGFRNIIVQHTTLADIEFVSDFNYTFYKDIITHPSQKINNIYEHALNCDIKGINPTIFCCCFHKHKTSCDFLKNLKNELYNNNECNDLNDFKELIPHFYHLYPGCSQSPTCLEEVDKCILNKEKQCEDLDYPFESFCAHLPRCFNKANYNFLPEGVQNKYSIKIKKKYLLNFCCCEEDIKIHNKNYVFVKDFSKENKNNEIRFRNAIELSQKQQYIPDYEKMISFIGNNKISFEILKFFSNEKLSLNIFGDSIENLKKFGDALKEYYQERYYLYKFDSSSTNIIRIKSAQILNINLSVSSSTNSIKNDDIKLQNTKSAPLIENLTKIKFEEINLNAHYNDSAQEDDNIKDDVNNNKIYFIYVHDIDLINRIKINSKKIVWFSEKQIEDNNIIIDKSIKFIQEPIPKDPNDLKNFKYYMNPEKIIPNEYIKFQNSSLVRRWRNANK